MAHDDQRAARAGALSDLASTVDDLADGVGNLRQELHEERLWRRRYRRLWFVAGVFVALVLVGLVAIALGNRATANRIEDCTAVDGDCYRRGQANTSRAVCDLIADNRELHDRPPHPDCPTQGDPP